VGLVPDTVSREEARHQLGLSESDYVFLFLGRINEYKGVFDLINAFRGLERSDTAMLLIAGLPENEENKERIVEETKEDSRIRTDLSRIEDEDLQYYFRASDVAVYPYRQILTSGAVILGMSFGSFLVVPDVPTIRETVAVGGGVFFQAGNASSLIEALSEALRVDRDGGSQANFGKAKSWRLSEVAEETLRSYA
jgi:glycosyltransferase involved in cell wall biosynthesis